MLLAFSNKFVEGAQVVAKRNVHLRVAGKLHVGDVEFSLSKGSGSHLGGRGSKLLRPGKDERHRRGHMGGNGRGGYCCDRRGGLWCGQRFLHCRRRILCNVWTAGVQVKVYKSSDRQEGDHSRSSQQWARPNPGAEILPPRGSFRGGDGFLDQALRFQLSTQGNPDAVWWSDFRGNSFCHNCDCAK